MGGADQLSSQWEMLPVLAFDGREFSIAGNLEPAYEIGGDTFDYSVEPHTLSVTITDAATLGNVPQHSEGSSGSHQNTLVCRARFEVPLPAQPFAADRRRCDDRCRRFGGRIGDLMTAVETLLILLLEDSRNVAARMAAVGYGEDEVRGAWNYAERLGTPRRPA